MSTTRCVHDPSYQSTLALREFFLPMLGKRMFSCKCLACGMETEPKETRYQAMTDAWYGCWRKEFVK